jgi:hypothetical protein
VSSKQKQRIELNISNCLTSTFSTQAHLPRKKERNPTKQVELQISIKPSSHQNAIESSEPIHSSMSHFPKPTYHTLYAAAAT